MPDSVEARVRDLPSDVARVLGDVVETARSVCGEHLVSVVLFGSAAEGQLRATSDVNVIFVLTEFDRTRIDRLREPLAVAAAAVRLEPMLLLRDEIPAAAEAFAQKFADVGRRHRVLFGEDPFAAVPVPRQAMVTRLRQVLLNLTLRLRAFYVERSLREEQLALVVADAAGPLRTCAATILELEGTPAPSPKEALRRLGATMAGDGWSETLARISEAREQRRLPPGVAPEIVLRLIDLTRHLQARARTL